MCEQDVYPFHVESETNLKSSPDKFIYQHVLENNPKKIVH